jgi:hypothetical protein
MLMPSPREGGKQAYGYCGDLAVRNPGVPLFPYTWAEGSPPARPRAKAPGQSSGGAPASTARYPACIFWRCDVFATAKGCIIWGQTVEGAAMRVIFSILSKGVAIAITFAGAFVIASYVLDWL